MLFLVLVLSLISNSCVTGLLLHGRDIDAPLLDSYDYIVVGCGISGLVVANRLSEDPVSVLCIEAGDADHYEAIIQNPVYVGADIGGRYDWDLSTVPQTQLDGATRPIPQGKVLGGGSILNAMCWNRGGADDYDAWEALGNPGWGWEGMLPYFIKSETYTPVYSEDIARQYSINYNPAVHGTSGPVQVSYPKYFYPQSVNLFEGLNYLGIPTEFDPNDGTSAGAAFVPTDLDPNNQTRSDARRTYFDPYASRANFHVITGQHATRVLIENVAGAVAVTNPSSGGNENGEGSTNGNPDGFGFGPGASAPPLDEVVPGDGPTKKFLKRDTTPGSNHLRITGVEFATNASTVRRTVRAVREVIIAAGALHSAQLLQLSGIGPTSLLDEYEIPVALDLPGVGNNLQDHCLVGTFYPYNNDSYPSPTELTTNATYNAEAEAQYITDKTGPWTAGSPNALAFPPLPLISNNSERILSAANEQEPAEHLVSGLDPSIVTGFTRQKQSLVQRLARRTTAAYEIINNNAGSLTLAVMHPFSRGTCTINSADPFEPPVIDPRWLSNPVDRQILHDALLFNREILATPSMRLLQAAQFVPPLDAGDEAIDQVINSGIRTEFHPSGTCAMLPLDNGGVVDSHLRVYGTQNLRVVDAGIFPMIPAAHLQAVVYGVAEKAADIIKADNGVPRAGPVLSSNTRTTTTSTESQASSKQTSTTTSLSAQSDLGVSTNGTSQRHTIITTSTSVFPVNTQSSGRSSLTGLSRPVSDSLGFLLTASALRTASASTSSDEQSDRSRSQGTQVASSSSVIMPSVVSTPVEGRTSSLPSIAPSSSLATIADAASSIMTASTPSVTGEFIAASVIRSSVEAALTSGGVPMSVATSLVPLVVGTTLTATPLTPEESQNAIAAQQEEQKAIAEFIKWLLHFFNLE